jgi:hypothetical protein
MHDNRKRGQFHFAYQNFHLSMFQTSLQEIVILYGLEWDSCRFILKLSEGKKTSFFLHY